MNQNDFDSLKAGLFQAHGWADGSNNRAMKHTVTVKGKKYTFEAATKEEFKQKLKELEESEE